MRVAIVDDEKTARQHLRAILEKHVPEAEIVGEASGVVTGLALLENGSIDIAFMDVEMKDGLGFDLLAQFENPNFQTIFITGHDQYAIQAFRYSATDYLIKPVFPADLKDAIAKAKQRNPELTRSAIVTLVENRVLNQEDKKIILSDNEAMHVVQIKDIIRCESDSNYTVFWFSKKEKLTISKTLKEYEKTLDDQPFFRVHKSHLINMTYVERFEKRDGGLIHLSDGSSVPLAVRKKEQFMEALANL